MRALNRLYYKFVKAVALAAGNLGPSYMYNPLTTHYFRHSANRLAPPFVDSVLSLYPEIKTAVDVGSGSGSYVNTFRKKGVSALGLEYSVSARRYAAKNSIPILPFDLSQKDHDPLAILGTADVAISIEVGEHIPNIFSEDLVKSLTRLSRLVLFSAAQPNQGGIGHINEQPPEYWTELFFQNKYSLAREETSDFKTELDRRYKGVGISGSWLLANLQVFRRFDE